MVHNIKLKVLSFAHCKRPAPGSGLRSNTFPVNLWVKWPLGLSVSLLPNVTDTDLSFRMPPFVYVYVCDNCSGYPECPMYSSSRETDPSIFIISWADRSIFSREVVTERRSNEATEVQTVSVCWFEVISSTYVTFKDPENLCSQTASYYKWQTAFTHSFLQGIMFLKCKNRVPCVSPISMQLNQLEHRELPGENKETGAHWVYLQPLTVQRDKRFNTSVSSSESKTFWLKDLIKGCRSINAFLFNWMILNVLVIV